MVAFEAYQTKTKYFIPSFIKVSQLGKEYFPNLNTDDMKLSSVKNECEFAITINNKFNEFALNHPDELNKLISLHEDDFLKWKINYPQKNYRDFSIFLENWIIDNTQFEFICPSKISTCDLEMIKIALIFSATEFSIQPHLTLSNIYKRFLNRIPDTIEMEELHKTIFDNKLTLTDFLFLLLTSDEYKGYFNK
jgi:hypothetical protein